PAAPSAHLTAGLPAREDDGLTTLHRRNPRGLGPALTPVALHLRRMSLQHPDLATYLFGPSLSAPLACLCLRRLRRFTWVGPTTRPWSPTALVLAVTTSTRAAVAILSDEDTLSRGLRTPPLPATHAPVGDCWQNSRCRHLLILEEQHTSRDTLVSHAYIPDRSKQQGRRFPLASISQALSIRFKRVSPRLADSIHWIQSLRATGVMSDHAARAFECAVARAFRRSAGNLGSGSSATGAISSQTMSPTSAPAASRSF